MKNKFPCLNNVIVYLWAKLPIISVLFLSGYLRFHGLSSRDIWYDETLDVLQSEKSLLEITHDVQTPLHYYIVHFFLLFGKNTFVLGLPSVIFGIGTVYVIYLIGKRFFNHQVGLIASFLAAISPMYIEFSRQILHYSYFNFFTVLGLYFFFDLLEKIGSRKFFSSILTFIAVSFLNLMTHVSSFLVLAIEGSFAALYILLSHRSKTTLRKYWLYLLIVCFVGGFFVLRFGNNGYLKTLSDITLNLSKPMKVGYSLTGYLGSDLLTFNRTFFYAMFSWFGIGPGPRLYVYSVLSILGLFSLFLKKKAMLLIFSLYWIVFPFVFLYVFKISHWFEEKYFFFIIPIYLLLIAAGISQVSSLLSSLIDRFKTRFGFTKTDGATRIIFFQTIFCFCIFLLSIYPNQQRTIYGFHRRDDPGYSWSQAITYIKSIMNPGDKVIMGNGEGIFFDFYFSKPEKNTVWFEEAQVLNLSPDAYSSLVDSNSTIYFASIPDFPDLFLGSIAKSTQIAKKGNFNIYTVKFQRNSPFVIEPDADGKWEYYDDYRTAKYVSESSERINLTSMYTGNYNVPVTYGYFNLSPIENKDSSIYYDFIIPSGTDTLSIYPVFSLGAGSSMKLSAGTGRNDMKEIYSIIGDGFSYYSPIIPLSVTQNSHLSLKIEFTSNTTDDKLKQIALKSLLITNKKIMEGIHLTVTKSGDYTYHSNLEIIRSNKWLFDTVVNEGWSQSLDGVLFDFWGEPEKTPIIYKFLFDNKVSATKLLIKTYTFNNNPITIDFGTNGSSWRQIDHFNDNETNTKTYNLNNFDKSDSFFLKVSCEAGGPTCQLRDFTISFMNQ